MNKFAIVLPYTVDQNEPSRPLSQLLELPNDVEKRDALLRKVFNKHVCDVDGELDDILIKEGSADNYGDIIVHYGDSVFMYVTFVTS